MGKDKNWAVVFGSLLTVVALAVVVTVAIWGAISGVRLAPRLFGSIEKSIRPETSLGLSPLEVVSGVPFTLSWEGSQNITGFYTILFACTKDLEITETKDDRQVPVSCGTPIETPASITLLRLLPRIVGDMEEVVIPVTIAHVSPQGEKLSEGMTTLTVVADTPAPEVVTQTEAPESGQPAVYQPPQTVGTPDLVIRPIAIGVVDPVTRQFIAKKTFGSYEIVSIKFDVANRGDGRTGNWYFTADLPTRTHTPYQSPIQQPLGPSDHIEFNLDFGTPVSGTIRIDVDPANTIRESNESNNTLSEYISVVY